MLAIATEHRGLPCRTAAAGGVVDVRRLKPSFEEVGGLDREACAADTSARLMSRARHPAQTGPAHQTEFTQALPGAWERR